MKYMSKMELLPYAVSLIILLSILVLAVMKVINEPPATYQIVCRECSNTIQVQVKNSFW